MRKTRMTSIQSYRWAVRSGIVSRTQREVLAVITRLSEHGVTDREIVGKLDLSINQVTARRNELVSKGLVREAGFRIDPDSGRRVHVWKTKRQIK